MYDRAISNRLLYTLFVTQSLFSASNIAVFTLVAIISVQLTGSDSVAGLASSTQTFAQALAAVPIAMVMGRFGRRIGLSLGYLLAALGALIGVIAITQSAFPLLLAGTIFIGMGRAGGEQARFAAGEMFPEAERG